MDYDKIDSVLKRLKSLIRSTMTLGDSLAIEAADDLIRDLRTECDNQATRIADLEEALEQFRGVCEAWPNTHEVVFSVDLKPIRSILAKAKDQT